MWGGGGGGVSAIFSNAMSPLELKEVIHKQSLWVGFNQLYW